MEEKIHMQSKIYRRQASGFTLIEVMVVIVILGVLAALIVPLSLPSKVLLRHWININWTMVNTLQCKRVGSTLW